MQADLPTPACPRAFIGQEALGGSGHARGHGRAKIQATAIKAPFAPGPLHCRAAVLRGGANRIFQKLKPGSVGNRQTGTADHQAQQTAQPRSIHCPQLIRPGPLGIIQSRRILPCQLLGQQYAIMKVFSRPAGNRPGVAPASTQGGQHRLAQIIAVEAGVLVAGILKPIKPLLLSPATQITAGHRQQWPKQRPAGKGTGRQCALQATQPGPAHQRQQHGFQLVIRVVGCDQNLAGAQFFGQGPIAGCPSGGFQACRAGCGHLHRQYRHADTKPRCPGPARGGPLPGPRLQAMIDVNGAHPRNPL